MAGHRSSSSEEPSAVFVDTSLGTHLAVVVHHSDSVADLKRKVIAEHLSFFPSLGEITIDAVKVKRRGWFYLLQDSMLLRTVFKRESYWYLNIDASASAAHLEDIAFRNGSGGCAANVPQREVLNVERDSDGREKAISDDLMDAGSPGAALCWRKKFKLEESSRRHEREDLVLHQRAGESGANSKEQTADFDSGLMIKEQDNEGRIIKKNVEKVLPVQEKVLIEVERSVLSGPKGGVDLAFSSHHRHPDGDEADNRAEKDAVYRVSFADNVDQSMLSSKKRKKPFEKKESGKNKIVDSKVEHGPELVPGSLGAIPGAQLNEPPNMEKQTTDNLTLVDKQLVPADAANGSRVQTDLSLVLGEKTELPDGDVANRRAEKEEVIPDLLAAGTLEYGSSRDKRKKSVSKKNSSRKRTVVPTEEHVLKHIEGSSGTVSLEKSKEPDNKDVDEMSISMTVVYEQGAVANTGHRGGIQHGPEIVLEEMNGQVNENRFAVSALSVDDEGEDASVKKRKNRARIKILLTDQENLQKHVDDLGVVSSMGTRESHNKKTGIEKSENVTQADEQALNAGAVDVSGVQNNPVQEENNGEFIDDEAVRGAEGDVSHNPSMSGVMEGKSSTKNRKKFSHIKESSKKKALDQDEMHVLKQYPINKNGPKHVEGPEDASSLPEPEEPDNTGKSTEEHLGDIMIDHEQVLGADTNYGSEVQNRPELLLPGENNCQILGGGAISGTGKAHVANELFTSGGVLDDSSRKKTKKSANKPGKKKTAYPEEKLERKQGSKEKLLPMHVEDSVGANSLAESKEADSIAKNTKEKAVDIVVVHEQTFDDDAGDRVQEENNEQLLGGDVNAEVKKVNSAPDLLASGAMDDKSSKNKRKKSATKPNKKKNDHTEEELALKQDPKEKVELEHVKDSTGANSLVKTKEDDIKEKVMNEKSADVVVVREDTFGAGAGAATRVQEENDEQIHGDEANDESEKVNFPLDLLASCAMEEESSKKNSKKSTNKKNKKKTLPLEEKTAPKENVVPKHVRDSVGANSSADNNEVKNMENSVGAVVVREQALDTDADDRVLEETNDQFYGDEATGKVEKVNLAPDVVVSDMVRNICSPKKKKFTQEKIATTEKPIDMCEDHKTQNIASSPCSSYLATPKELVNSKNSFSVVEGNGSVTPVSYEKTADGLGIDVDSQETFKRKGMSRTAQETQRKGKGRQIAMVRSVEQLGNDNASNEMSKKENPKFIQGSTVSQADNGLSSSSPARGTDGKLEESGRIKFGDYFTRSRAQVAVATSTNEVALLKGSVKINPPNSRKSKDSEASASTKEVIKSNKKRRLSLDRYRVTFRDSNQSLQAPDERQKRSLLNTSGSIFKDESSGSSDNGQESGMSDATRTPSDDSVSSDYSDGDINALKKSQGNGNNSQQNGRRSNMKNMVIPARKDIGLTNILQSSSRYKRAKRAASQSEGHDMDGEPVDFVPDSQADV